MKLEGTYTAIVTPFRKNGVVDYDAFRKLIEMQIEAGVDGIVPVGTTGESPVLSFDEHKKVIEFVVKTVNRRTQVIAGTGANSTSEALELTRHAIDIGVDATLQVTPYYNRPSQEGLIKHFTAVAELGAPVVLYNIPSRTGREIEVSTVVKLAQHPNIIGLKEAGGSVDRVSAIVTQCKITVLSGDDSLTLPMMAVGARGVISVASNIIPGPIKKLTDHMLAGRLKEAMELHLKYYPLFRDLFIDTNPVPVKAALAMMGLIEEVYRLPLCEMSAANKEKLRETLKKVGVPVISK
jgi:4-hydroxy-tetrahydrodipicolinate synthase